MLLRFAGYLAGYAWALPNSVLGLGVAAIGSLGGGHWRIRGGVLEVSGPLLAWLLTRATAAGTAVEAMTLGHVVIGRDAHCLARCRAHERVHVRQYARWGVLFLPAYFLSSAWQMIRGGDAYRDNHFERQAYALAPITDRSTRTSVASPAGPPDSPGPPGRSDTRLPGRGDRR